MPFGIAASNDCRDASPVVPTAPQQAEGDMPRSGGRMLFLSSGESRGTRAERPLQIVWQSLRQTTVETLPVVPTDPPQAEGNMPQEGREACCFSPLESREVHERRGRYKSFGGVASIDCRDASPVVPTDPPQEIAGLGPLFFVCFVGICLSINGH